MTKPLGPNFGGELIAAGLGGLPIAWAPDGGISGRGNLTPEQNAMLDAAIAAHDPDARPPALVPKRVIVDRLQAAGKLAAARTALDAQDLYSQERWNARDAILANDPTAVALLAAIGADPAAILAPP
jgi:hypothetical protein